MTVNRIAECLRTDCNILGDKLKNHLLLAFILAQDPPHPPGWARVSSFTRFLDHTQRRTTVGRTLLQEGSVRRRDLYLTTHNIHSRRTSMPPVGFEPTISVDERPQIYALRHAATGTGCVYLSKNNCQKIGFSEGHNHASATWFQQ